MNQKNKFMKKILPFLAVACSGFLVYIFDKIFGSSIDWEKVKSVKIGKLITTEFTLFEILTFIAFSIIIYFIGKKLLQKEKSFYSKKQLKLREFNNMEINEANVLLRWVVYFGTANKPFITDLTAFCKNHGGAPLRFTHNRCSIRDCENNRIEFNEYGMKNAIESDLIEKWEKLK